MVTTAVAVAALVTACVGAIQGPVPAVAGAACRPADGPVTWVSAASAAEGAQQDAWCAAVGAPVVLVAEADPAPAVSGAPPPGGLARAYNYNRAGKTRVDSLLVVTWNVKVGGGDLSELVHRLRNGAFTGGVPVAHFALLLQEAHRSGSAVPDRIAAARVPRGISARAPDGRRTSIEEAARALGLSLAYVPSMRNGGRTGEESEDRGNAIVTTLPLRDVAAIELPLARQRRVAVATTVAGRTTSGAPWELQLVSVHLENRPSRGVTGVREREQQMKRLLERLPSARLSVIGGDLNTWADGEREPAVSLALRHYPDTGATPAEFTLDGPAFFDVRLDYLFARLPGGRLTGYDRIDQRYGSDHHPVLAWVHLPQAAVVTSR